MGLKSNIWLVAYIEHIAYEVTGLVTSYMRMTKIDEYGKHHPIGIQGEKNDCLDLMALHFRNLYEFFCYPSKNGYVRAVDYVPTFTATDNNWLIEKANNQVTHLTEKRHELAKDLAIKSWDPNEVMKWLICTLEDWQDKLDNKFDTELCKRLSIIQDFIDWYRDQIKQGKV